MSYPVDAPQGPCDQNGIPIWHCQAKMPDGSECANRCEVAISQSEKNNGKMYHKCNVKDPVTNEYHNFRKWTTDLQEKKSWGNSMMPARNVPNSGQSAQTVHTQSAQVAASSLMELAQKVELLAGALLENKQDIKELIQHVRASMKHQQPAAPTSLPVAAAPAPVDKAYGYIAPGQSGFLPFPGGSGYANAGMAGASAQAPATPASSPSYA